MSVGKRQKPVFGLRSERASWVVLWTVLAYPIYFVILVIVDPSIVALLPHAAGFFLILLALPVYSIWWFRRRRREAEVASCRDT